MDKIIDILTNFKKRIERLESNRGASRFVPPNYSSDPSPGIESEIYYNTATQKHRGYDGTTWHDLW